jgi:hypothetical protein
MSITTALLSMAAAVETLLWIFEMRNSTGARSASRSEKKGATY